LRKGTNALPARDKESLKLILASQPPKGTEATGWWVKVPLN
jgi:hypothetical protein